MIELEMKAGVTKTNTEFCCKLFSVLPEEHREEIKEHRKKLRKGDVDQLVMQEALDDLAQAHRDWEHAVQKRRWIKLLLLLLLRWTQPWKELMMLAWMDPKLC